MKKNKMELIVGGTILIALFILIAGVLWLKAAMVTSKMVHYTVLFPNVGTLQLGDPVMVNGVKKGTVADIALQGTTVAVIIDLDKEVPLTDASRITVQNIGLMGERMVGIQLNNGGKLYRPNGKKGEPITVIPGFFDTGIAEAMGMIGSVLTDVRLLVRNIGGIIDSTVGDSLFVMQFKRIISRLDTVTTLAGKLIAESRPSISRSVASIEKLTADINGLLDSNKVKVTTLMSNGVEISSRGVVIAAAVDSLTRTLGAMVSSINRGEGSAGLLLKNDRFYYDLKKTVIDLDSFVNVANRKGVKLEITKLHWPW